MQIILRKYFLHAAVKFMSTAIFVWPAMAAEGPAPIPDFSGPWARNSVDFEQPLSGAGPVVNLSRRPNGARDHNRLVGDYTNPILKPAAAAEVQKHGEISLSGGAYPTPTNQPKNRSWYVPV